MQTTQAKNQTGGILGMIERIGNKIPDITILFIGAFVLCCIMSAILSTMHFGYVHPTTGKEIVVNNMLSGKNLVTLLSKMVTNYSGFPPLGMVIVATLGIGIADGSGYINTALKKILAITPKFLITPIIILVGMLSHLGPDTGYVIIIPVAAYMYYASGKHPLAGIGASFAGIAGAFAANYTPSAIDPVIQGFTQSAAQIIDPTYQVNVLCNYFYAFGATFLVIPSCWWVTEKVVEPWLWKNCPLDDDIEVGRGAEIDRVGLIEVAIVDDIGLAGVVTIDIGQVLGEGLAIDGEAGGIEDMQGAGFQRLDGLIDLFDGALGGNILIDTGENDGIGGDGAAPIGGNGLALHNGFDDILEVRSPVDSGRNDERILSC